MRFRAMTYFLVLNVLSLCIAAPMNASAALFKGSDVPWFRSVTVDQSEIASALANRTYDVDVRDNRGWTGLMVACDALEVELATQLIRAGANVAALSRDKITLGFTPLHFLLANMNDTTLDRGLELLKLLFDNGADPNVKNAEGNTPLHVLFAIDKQENLIKVLHMLVIYGTDLNARGKDGMTFLHNLVFERNSRTITLLRHRYPFLLDLSVKNNSGMTPLEYAQSFRFDELITALSESTVEYKNLGVIDYDQSGFNSLMIAALRGDISMAQQFVDGKGSMNAVAQDTFNDTAFHYALRCNKIEFVQWLLNHGSSVTIKNNDGDMALHVLARLVNSSLFNVLLPTITKQPTLLNMQNKNGDTPIHILVARKAFDLLKLEIDQFCSSIDFSVRNVQNESPEEVAQRIDDQKIVSLIVSAFRRQEARRK